LGGGTALMLHANHRLSKDIDAFVDDPQYLGIMSQSAESCVAPVVGRRQAIPSVLRNSYCKRHGQI
jgi:hypothetical protein